MIVNVPVRTTRGSTVRITSTIESRRFGAIDLWFEAGGDAGAMLTRRSDPFAAAALACAVVLGEELEVRGVTSPRLAWGLRELMFTTHGWWPAWNHLVDLRFERLEEPGADEQGTGVGCGWSGGVDSFYTLLRHRPSHEPIPQCRITHLVMVNGFGHDDDDHAGGTLDSLEAIYRPLAGCLGLGWVQVRTNVKELREPVIGDERHHWLGPMLACVPLALAPMFRRYYIAGADFYGTLKPAGTHPLLDVLPATEALHVIHDGCEVTRAEKVTALAEWDEARSLLRVCDHPAWKTADPATGRATNCSRCTKCVRTMITLEVADRLRDVPAFTRPLTFRSIQAMRYEWPYWTHRLISLTAAAGRLDLTAALLCALPGAHLRVWVRRFRWLLQRRKRAAAQPRRA
jgi:hypothetical protein